MNNGFENNLVLKMNEWGVHHTSTIAFLADKLVYITIALGALWFVSYIYQHTRPFNVATFLWKGIKDGLILLVGPVFVATAISEFISKLYIRQRPFVSVKGVSLLTPHTADGGMPSHHTVFMIALAYSIFLLNRNTGLLLMTLTIVCGFARVVAGIHFPTDIIAGLIIGVAAASVTTRGLAPLRRR